MEPFDIINYIQFYSTLSSVVSSG